MGCAGFDPAGPMVTSTVGFVDCQARAWGADGWAALGLHTGFGVGLTAMMVCAVALFGWRMMLSGRVGLADGLGLVLRIGAVLALVGQWPAWQALAYDAVLGAGDELAGAVLAPSGLGGQSMGDLAARVDDVGAGLAALRAPNAAALANGAPMPQESVQRLGTAGRIITMSALAALVGPRVASGLVLALGPVAAAMLLFGATRGLALGWARAAVASIVAQVALAGVLALELAVITPQMALLGQLGVDQAAALAERIWLAGAGFAGVMVLVLGGVVLAVCAWGWPRMGLAAGRWSDVRAAPGAVTGAAGPQGGAGHALGAGAMPSLAMPAPGDARALRLADGLGQNSGREHGLGSVGHSSPRAATPMVAMLRQASGPASTASSPDIAMPRRTWK